MDRGDEDIRHRISDCKTGPVVKNKTNLVLLKAALGACNISFVFRLTSSEPRMVGSNLRQEILGILLQRND